MGVIKKTFFLFLFFTFFVLWFAAVLKMPMDHEDIKDEPWHVSSIIKALDAARSIQDIAQANVQYPPAYYMLAFASCKIADAINRMTLALPNFLLFIILLLIVARLGNLLYGSFSSMAAFLIAGIFYFPYSFQMTTNMSIIVSVALYFLLSYELTYREDIRRFVFYGLSIAFAFLSKQTAIVFLVVPLILLIYGRTKANRFTKQFFIKLLISITAGLLLAYLLFYRSWQGISLIRDLARRSMKTHGEIPFTPENLFDNAIYYSAIMIGSFAALVIASAIHLVRSKGQHLERHLNILLSVWIPIGILSLFPTKYVDYILPVISLWIVLLCSALQGGDEKRKIVSAIYAAAFFITIFSLVSFVVRNVRYDFRSYKAQELLIDDLAEQISRNDMENGICFYSGTRKMAGYSYNNHMLMRHKPKFCLREFKEAGSLPDFVVVFRTKSPADPSTCYTMGELNAWKASKTYISPPADEEARLALRLITDFKSIHTMSNSYVWNYKDKHYKPKSFSFCEKTSFLAEN